MLRTCDADLKSDGGFIWPSSGYVACTDWNPRPEYGGGLHGLLMGTGDSNHLSRNRRSVWLVVEVYVDEVVVLSNPSLDGNRGCDEVKVPRTTPAGVVYCGDREGAIADILARGADPATCVYVTRQGGDRAILAGGHHSTLIGGYRSTLTGGDHSTLTGGDHSTVTGGYHSTVTGGDGSTLIGGQCATLTGGDRSTLTSSGHSVLIGGHRATLTGWYGSTLISQWWDGDRSHVVVAECGEGGLRPGVAYIVRGGKFVRVDSWAEALSWPFS